jgi:hypothetical protein
VKPVPRPSDAYPSAWDWVLAWSPHRTVLAVDWLLVPKEGSIPACGSTGKRGAIRRPRRHLRRYGVGEELGAISGYSDRRAGPSACSIRHIAWGVADGSAHSAQRRKERSGAAPSRFSAAMGDDAGSWIQSVDLRRSFGLGPIASPVRHSCHSPRPGGHAAEWMSAWRDRQVPVHVKQLEALFRGGVTDRSGCDPVSPTVHIL